MASTTMGAAGMAVRKSGSIRRGPQNPNRGRQPRRMGAARRMFGAVAGMARKVLKGRNRGMA